MSQATIAFIGAGHLAHALIAGLLRNQYDPQKIWAADPSLEKLEEIRQQFEVQTTADNSLAVAQADVVILAVKPVHIHALCVEIKNAVLQQQPLVVSVAVGATTDLLEKWLGMAAVVRAMPNTPAMVGAGATGLYASQAVSARQREWVELVFRAVGMTLWVEEEKQIDWVCAVSGCGPGYIFLMMEAFAVVAEQSGLSASASRLLIAQTFLGAARVALESQRSFTDLLRQVMSPNGATERAVQVLRQGNLSQLLQDAIAAAQRRCEEVSDQLD